MSDKQHETCTELEALKDSHASFRRLVISILGLQGVFVIGALMIAINIMRESAGASEQRMQLKTRQEMIEAKADAASKNALQALAISGKAESNIAWIREGLTELKISVRERMTNTKTTP